jgi:MFS family permease
VQTANLAASVALCVSTLIIGAATDRFGVRRVAVPTLLLLIVSTYALYLGAKVMPGALLPLYALAGFGAGAVVLTPIIMIHAFPASIRFSGVSFCYNVGYAVFGGMTPLLVTWLVHLDRIGPAHYIAAATVAGLVATLMAPRHKIY